MSFDSNVILEVKNLNVEFTTDDGIVHAVNNVSYKVERQDASNSWRIWLGQKCFEFGGHGFIEWL
jgi:hypothetical protein